MPPAGDSPVAPPPLRRRLPAEPSSVPAVRAAARDYAEEVGLAPDATAAVALAITEAATNAVVHAFVGTEPGTVTLVAQPVDGEVVFRVCDDGRGMTPRVDSPGLGLGLPTIGRLCSHFDVGPGPDGRGTQVCMAFAAPHLAGARDDRLRRRLEHVFGAMADAVTVADDEGHVVYANRAAAELLGAASPQEVVDSAGGELAARFRITLADGSPVGLDDLPHWQVLRNGGSATVLTRSVHLASGRARWLETTATPLEDDELRGRHLAVSVIRDVTEATDREHRQRFLAEAGERLASSLDLHETFGAVARLAVPELADWCAVDIPDDDGILQRVALAHRDPEKVAMGAELHRRWPPDPAAEGGSYTVLRTGEPIFIADLPDDLLASSVADPENLAALRAIGLRSVIMAPMVAHDRTLGVLTLVNADSARNFEDADVEFAMGVARRAGLAIDTAQRFAGRDQA